MLPSVIRIPFSFCQNISKTGVLAMILLFGVVLAMILLYWFIGSSRIGVLQSDLKYMLKNSRFRAILLVDLFKKEV